MRINKDIFKAKYQHKDESFEQMCQRISNTPEQFEIFVKGDAMLGGSHLRARGANSKMTLFNCYALGLHEDSKKGIQNLEKRADEVASRGGGIGTNFSILRPKDAPLRGFPEYDGSSGSVSFMDRFAYNQSTMSRGKSRRSALLGTISVYHPDIEEFIKAKSEQDIMSNMNISVFVDDDFMEADEDNEDIHLFFPNYMDFPEKYDKEWDGDLTKWRKEGKPIKIYNTMNARYIFDLICSYAHKNGEPGVLFESAINKYTPIYERILETNACAELPMPAESSCNL